MNQDNNKEQWRIVKGLRPASCQIYASDRGRVKVNKDGKEIILHPYTSGSGYKIVYVSDRKHKYCYFIHRLVGVAFCENPQNKPQINHKDEDKTNNHVSNLEWCTAKENMNWGTLPQRIGDKHRKAIVGINSHGQVADFLHLKDCCGRLGICNRHLVSNAIRNNTDTTKDTIRIKDAIGETWILFYVARAFDDDGKVIYVSPTERKRMKVVARKKMAQTISSSGKIRATLPRRAAAVL